MITFKYEFKIVANGLPRICEIESGACGWYLSIQGFNFESENQQMQDLINTIQQIDQNKTTINVNKNDKNMDCISDDTLLKLQQTCIELENLIKDLNNDKHLNEDLLLNDFINENYNFDNNYVVIAVIKHLLSEQFKVTNAKGILDKIGVIELGFDVWDVDFGDFGNKMSFTVGEYGKCEKYAISYLEENAEELMGTDGVPSHIKDYIDTKKWVGDVISEGLGNCLSGYDGCEYYEVVDGTDYYIYRTN